MSDNKLAHSNGLSKSADKNDRNAEPCAAANRSAVAELVSFAVITITMESSQHKAESFVEYAEFVSGGSWETFFKNKPHVWDATAENGYGQLTFEQKSGKWDFLMMVAMAWWVNNLAHIQLSTSEFETIAKILSRRVADWNPGAIPAFSDLNNFICGYARESKNMSDPEEVAHFTKLLVGTWFLWNLTNKANFPDDSQLAALLGELIFRYIDNYWYAQPH